MAVAARSCEGAALRAQEELAAAAALFGRMQGDGSWSDSQAAEALNAYSEARQQLDVALVELRRLSSQIAAASARYQGAR